jgi:hypothetical protein
MTFRDFVEQSPAEYEADLRREELMPATIDMRLRGAQQFGLLLLGEPPRKGAATPRRVQETGRRFGGPRN